MFGWKDVLYKLYTFIKTKDAQIIIFVSSHTVIILCIFTGSVLNQCDGAPYVIEILIAIHLSIDLSL